MSHTSETTWADIDNNCDLIHAVFNLSLPFVYYNSIMLLLACNFMHFISNMQNRHSIKLTKQLYDKLN
jgi:hypothetical protein